MSAGEERKEPATNEGKYYVSPAQVLKWQLARSAKTILTARQLLQMRSEQRNERQNMGDVKYIDAFLALAAATGVVDDEVRASEVLRVATELLITRTRERDEAWEQCNGAGIARNAVLAERNDKCRAFNKMRKERDAALKALREIEWNGGEGVGVGLFCPSCGCTREQGHFTACSLWPLIK